MEDFEEGRNDGLHLKHTYLVVDYAVRGQTPVRSRIKKQLYCHPCCDPLTDAVFEVFCHVAL